MKVINLIGISLLCATTFVHAGVIRVDESNFNSGSGLITFSEFAVGTMNPIYSPADYGGEASDPVVTLNGFFLGQSLSLSPNIDCPNAAATACFVGAPTAPISLDGNAPGTVIVSDVDNPTSPVLSGSPVFNGGIAILFSEDQFGVGFDGGFFDAPSSTAITAFARDGSLLGSVLNNSIGVEFLGLVTDDGLAQIAGVFLDLVGEEPAGFAVDNIRFGQVEDVSLVSSPSAIWLLFSSFFAFLGAGLKRKEC